MRNPAGGSEHRTLSLFELLAHEGEVNIWSEEPPHPSFAGLAPIKHIGPNSRFPQGGVLVFIGTYFSIGSWIQMANPARMILVHNLDQPERLRSVYSVLGRATGRPVEIVYASSKIAAQTPDLPGRVEASPIAIDSFSCSRHTDRFVVGRLSRDVPEKHHPEDPALYESLIEDGISVKVMGGTTLSREVEELNVLPENAVSAPDFLCSLDCFVYRTHPAWLEAFGRVIPEAMASSLAIVAEPRHGYAEILRHGHDVLFASTTSEFQDAIVRLRDDVELRRRLGANARQTVEKLYGPEYARSISAFYYSG